MDDELPYRFPRELAVLKQEGWEVTSARSVLEAARRLSSRVFDAVLLNLVFPYDFRWRENVGAWGGVVLCHWLHGLPIPPEAPAYSSLDRLGQLSALDENRAAPVALFSGYAVQETLELIETALGRRVGLCMKIEPPEELLRFLEDEVLQHSLESNGGAM